MLELNIPQSGEETKNTKDLIFSILTIETNLSLIELTKRIRKDYNISITYQAVRKAVDNLIQQKVLKKINNFPGRILCWRTRRQSRLCRR